MSPPLIPVLAQERGNVGVLLAAPRSRRKLISDEASYLWRADNEMISASWRRAA